ncbi:MAG: serine hydrolase [Gemmatimonadaceae bacterium]
MKRITSEFLLAISLAIVAARPAFAQDAWRQYATAEEAGFSSVALDSARRVADSLGVGAVFVVYRGRVLAAWGDVSRKLHLHSVRKSLTSALYGIAVESKRIELSATLAQLGIDDTTRLSADEKAARVRDVIAARSGVYLPAAYAPADQDSTRPARGAHRAGTFWFYNNWDFNVAESIYQQRTGESVYDDFARRIAHPIGMEDLSPGDGFLAYEPQLSLYPAHTWRMSARDLARFGQLYLQQGRWNGRQVVPAPWISVSTSPISDFGNGRGYGYMWWTYAPGSYGSRFTILNKYASYAGSGTGGQAVIVIPEAQLVVVHRGDTDHNRNIAGGRVWGLVESILAARRGEPKPKPALVALSPVSFTSQLPPLEQPNIMPASRTEGAALVGEYDVGAPERVRVTVFRDRLFMYLPRRGQAELLRVGEWRYTIGVLAGVTIVSDRNASGAVQSLTIRMGGQVINARRVE